MLRAILNKSWRQHPTRHQLYGHLPPITKTIQVRRTRHAGHCWRSRDELIRDVLLWTPTHGRAKAGRSARTYIQQLCEDTGCCPEDLPRAMNDREEWRERVWDVRATSATWWWWYLKIPRIFVYPILQDGFWVVHTPLVRMVKFKFLARFQVDHLLHPVVSSLYYYYLLLIRVFHLSVSWWSFTGDWVTASLLKSPGLFSVFWPFSIMLLFGWSQLGRQLLNPPGPLIVL